MPNPVGVVTQIDVISLNFNIRNFDTKNIKPFEIEFGKNVSVTRIPAF